MNALRNISLRWKLLLAILLTSILVLSLTCGVLIVQELISFRNSLVREVTVLANVLAKNTTAAVSFSDESTAKEILEALRAEPHIMAAGLYGNNNELFAAYDREGASHYIPKEPGPDGPSFETDGLVLFRPVMLNDKRVGTIFLQSDLEGIHERLKSFALTVGLILPFAIAVAFGLSVILQRLISNPILALAATARNVTETRDYSVRAEPQGTDETGQLTDAFNQMLAEIEVRQIALQEANESLRTQAGQILESVGVISTAAQEISSFSTHLATSATESATAVTQTTTTAEQVRQTTHVASQRAQQVADSSLKTAQVTQLGRESTEATMAGMNRIRQQMDAIADSMVHLSEQTQAISQIIATVDDLAAQSNLLAVNAAIEAAKAGEQGRGFSVVAHEIKSLAEQSKQATRQVRSILADIQKATGTAVMATEQGSKAVEAGVKQSAQAGDSIQALADSVAESAQAATQIATTSRQQLIGVDQVVAAMDGIKQASAQNVTRSKQLESSARNLNELGQKLKSLVEHYKA